MCTDVLMNDYVGRGKETFTYMYKECKHYSKEFQSMIARGKKLFNVDVFETRGTG